MQSTFFKNKHLKKQVRAKILKAGNGDFKGDIYNYIIRCNAKCGDFYIQRTVHKISSK